jgi:hydroxymethylbilane synthase
VAAPPREDPRDVTVGAALDTLPSGARVGTSALRRRAQILAARPDLEVVELRGNVDTRLRKLADGEVDALVLAAAGLLRLGRELGVPLDFVPAQGQGTLALQARVGDERAAALNDPPTWRCLLAERAAVVALGATCHTPVGVHHDGTRLRGFAGLPDGSAWVLDELDAEPSEEAGRELASRMLAAGARELLAAVT